jgi:hypothetical protein
MTAGRDPGAERSWRTELRFAARLALALLLAVAVVLAAALWTAAHTRRHPHTGDMSIGGGLRMGAVACHVTQLTMA